MLERSVERHVHLALNFMFRSSCTALSDATVRQAKATGKDYTLGDSDGLSLGVSGGGSKSWHFRGRVLKKGRQSTLEQIERVFDNDVLPALGKSSIYSIKRHDSLDVLA